MKHLAGYGALAVVVMMAIVAVGWTPRVELFVAVAVALAVITVALRTLGEMTMPARWPRPVPRVTTELRTDPRVTFLESSLRRATEDGAAFTWRVRPVLTEVAAHRLGRMGIDVDREPERARAALDAETWAALQSSSAVPEKQLVHIVERIEGIG